MDEIEKAATKYSETYSDYEDKATSWIAFLAGCEYMNNGFIPPFRVGKKQRRAVLDCIGKELVVFPKGREFYAQQYVDFLNAHYESAINAKQ